MPQSSSNQESRSASASWAEAIATRVRGKSGASRYRIGIDRQDLRGADLRCYLDFPSLIRLVQGERVLLDGQPKYIRVRGLKTDRTKSDKLGRPLAY
jgi:hypothetical protein